MRIYCLTYLLILLSSCQPTDVKLEEGREIINKSINFHDPAGKWKESVLHLHIQEPRVGNPQRYSIVKLDVASGAFELTRNRDEHTSTHLIDEKGEMRTYFDGEITTDTLLINKYRLNPQRNANYRSFYQMLYGLPMTLTADRITALGPATQAQYNNLPCYKVPITLAEPMFSKHWNIYIRKSNYAFAGMEIVFPDEPEKGERLYFAGSVNLSGILTPRMRHWYEYNNETYLGSDVIVVNLME